MPSLGEKVPVLKPARLKRGYYFRTCRPFRTEEGVLYDYVLYSPQGHKLKLQSRG